MDNQEFYVVQPEQLRFPYLGQTLQWRRDQLRGRLRSKAALWGALRTRSSDLLQVLSELGAAIGKGQELADFVFENSPFEVLTLNSADEYNSFFGYFPPLMVSEYFIAFEALPDSFIDSIADRNDDGLADRILHALKSTFREASSRGCAVAIDHC